MPHYRDRKTPEFQALVDQVYKILTNPDLSDETVTAPAESVATVSQPQPPQSAKYQSLPQMRPGAIAGLLELLEDRKEKDLYRLGQELMLEVDDILPIVEAAKLMEFLVIQEGDLLLTPVGIQFIAGGIDQRKEIVRTQILSNIRLVQQISRMLQSKRNQRISEELILDILEAHFSPQEAMRQLKTAIDWGRYAELYSYDEPGGEIFLEAEYKAE